jgi:hypothetical protein
MAEIRAVAGVASVAFTAHATLTVRATVEAVAEAIHPPGVTLADLQTLAALLNEATRAAAPAERIAEQVGAELPIFGSFGQFIRANEALITLITLVVTVITLLHDWANNRRIDPPPSVIVQVEPPNRAEVERIVEEKLRELCEPDEKPAG